MIADAWTSPAYEIDSQSAVSDLRLNVGVLSVLLGGIIAVSGCAGDSTVSNGVHASRVVGDTIYVEFRGASEPNVHLVEELSIGDTLAAEEAYSFSSVGALAVDDQGKIFVYDDDARQLRSYDARGEYIRNIGRQGAGPGEYRHIGGMAVDSDGRLIVSDPFNGRIIVFSKDGVPLQHIPRDFGAVVQQLSNVWTDTSGNAILPLNPYLTHPVGQDSARSAFVRLRSDGRVRDTLFAPGRIFRDCPIRPESRYRSGFIADIREPYVFKARWGVTAIGEVISGCPETYEFDLTRQDSSVLRFVMTDWVPVMISANEIDNHMKRWVRSKRLSGSKNFTWDGVQFAPHKPAYGYFLSDFGDRIWVWVPQSGLEVPIQGRTGAGAPKTKWIDPPGPIFDIFSTVGNFEGRVQIPSNISFEASPRTVPPVVRGDTVWAVTRDSMGVEGVTRYRLDFDDSPRT